MNRLAIPAGVLVAALGAAREEGGSPWAVLHLDSPQDRAALRDVDGDGDDDIVVVTSDGLRLRRMDAEGRYPEDADLELAWPSDQVAWNLADLDGDGGHEVVLFEDGERVVRYRAGADAFEAGDTLLEARGDLPRGIFHMDFCRDVDGDGRLDVVLPGFGHYAIHRRGEDGGWKAPLEVAMQVDVRADFADPGRLGDTFGQDVDIPWFRLEDVDGDGRRDLRAQTDERVFFHLAGDAGLPDEPTWVLDVESLENELPPQDGVDLDDLLSMAGRQVQWRLAQLAGDRPRDLVVQVGSKFRIYHGGSRSGPRGTPDQLLKSSGNVLFFFLRDADGDGMADLQLLRGEGLSLARMLRWLVLPGRLDFQLYTYTNTGGELSVRPSRRNTIALEIPRLLSFMKRMEEMEEQMEAGHRALARLIALDEDGVLDDIVDCRDGKLYFYRNGEIPGPARALAELEEERELTRILELLLLEDLDRRGDGATRSIDLDEIDEWDLSAGAALRAAASTLEAEWIVPLPVSVEASSLQLRDLDRNGRADVIVIGRKEPARRCVQLLVR